MIHLSHLQKNIRRKIWMVFQRWW